MKSCKIHGQNKGSDLCGVPGIGGSNEKSDKETFIGHKKWIMEFIRMCEHRYGLNTRVNPEMNKNNY